VNTLDSNIRSNGFDKEDCSAQSRLNDINVYGREPIRAAILARRLISIEVVY